MKGLIIFCLLGATVHAAERVEVLTVDGTSFRGYVYRNGATKSFQLLGVGSFPETGKFQNQLIGGKAVHVEMRGEYAVVSVDDMSVNLEVIKSG